MMPEGDPTGEVNAVCWKFLAIAGTFLSILGSVVVVLAKKLWEISLARLDDKNDVIAQLQAAKNLANKKKEESP